MSDKDVSDREDSPEPLPALDDDNDEEELNTFNILIATDNHVGYLERDPIRGQDSINTFREILQIARKREVDCILLGGDLFHENRPSRDCLYQVMGLLREYTLGDKPVYIELLSSKDEGKPASYNLPGINYEDQNLNVAIPVFSIHGNHDDPQGAGPEGALCALDMLSVAGLVNYIGKLDLAPSASGGGAEQSATSEGITIRPVLLRKGTSRLALYGVGNVRDARMHFELRANRVRMYMPRDRAEWFNLMVVHQNRVRHGPQEFVPEGLFDDSIDLVVWGHEHDCRVVPESVAGKRYRITQPGSSVATSLAEGESLEKKIALLKVRGKRYALEPIPLRTVRPFVMDDIVLTEIAEEEGFDVTDQVAIGKYLKTRVNELIERANREWDERSAHTNGSDDEPPERMLPLVRLKVDTTGIPAMQNPHRFGQEFTGRLANPRDVLVFHRAKQASSRRGVKADEPGAKFDEDAEEGEGVDGDDGAGGEGGVGKVRVHKLVQEYLRAQELQLLSENTLADAIQLFVEKDDTHAVETHVSKHLKNFMDSVRKHPEFSLDQIETIVEDVRHEQAKEYAERRREEKSATAKGKSKGKGKARATADDDEEEAEQSEKSVDSMAMDIDVPASDFDSDPAPAPTRKRATTTTKTTTTRAKTTTGAAKTKAKAPAAAKKPAARGKKKAAVESDEEDEEVDEIDEDEDEPPPPPKRRTTAAATTAAAKKAPAKRSTATTSKARAGSAAASAASQSQTTLTFAPTGARSTRAAAGRARKKTAEVIDVDSD